MSSVDDHRFFEPTLDGGVAYFKRIGLFLLSMDAIGERAFGDIVRSTKAQYFTARFRYDDRNWAKSLDLILPEAGVDVVAFGCTSLAAAMGREDLEAQVHAVRGKVSVTDPLQAAVYLLSQLGARRIGIVTPYNVEEHRKVCLAIESAGYSVPGSVFFGISESVDFARLTPRSLYSACAFLTERNIDGIFISCTGVRADQVASQVEADFGIPVVTSIAALATHSLILAGLHEVPVRNVRVS